jgi:mono/diheme cytochrome c family protein
MTPVVRRVVLVALICLVLACAVLLALAWRPSIAAIEPPAAASFDAATVEQGRRLAAVGSCGSCHTVAEGRPFAGGAALATPFGTIHGTNLTPDAETGIGRWSEAAFVRAMRDGVARDGTLLYPAFPYDHYTHTADADLHALYAYLMTRDPVRAPNPANGLRFPFNVRPLLAGWNLLYLDRTPWRTDPTQDALWNRGAYLVQSLGHCGSCHAPRNAFGAEQVDRGLAGGEAEGWYVPALNADSPSPLPWTVEQLTTYLRTGIATDHAIAGGPMQTVVSHLAEASPDDVRAIATYIRSSLGPETPAREARARATVARAAQPLALASRSVAGAIPVPGIAAATAVSASSTPPSSATSTSTSTSTSTAAAAATTSTSTSTATATAPSGAGASLVLGASVYSDACARCHDAGRAISSAGALRLQAAVALHDPDPRSLLRIIREGIAPPDGEPGRWMPAFGATLTDEQLVALVGYLRQQGAGAPPWPDLAQKVRDTKASP